MPTSFPRLHSSLLLKYLGMSFITGAVAHGFFSSSRSLITAVLGIIFFLIGHLMMSEHTSAKELSLQSLLAVGVGIFTGGIQHFPDSPERSVWIVPLGLLISLAAFMRLHPPAPAQAVWKYSALIFAVALGLSL